MSSTQKKSNSLTRKRKLKKSHHLIQRVTSAKNSYQVLIFVIKSKWQNTQSCYVIRVIIIFNETFASNLSTFAKALALSRSYQSNYNIGF